MVSIDMLTHLIKLGLKCCLLITSPKSFIRKGFIIEANTMNPDQIAPLRAVFPGSIRSAT